MTLFDYILLLFFVLWIWSIIDTHFFMKNRYINYLVKETNKKGRCIVCKRPMKIVSDEEYLDSLENKDDIPTC